MMEDILLEVQKPARYIGSEWNVSRKDFERSWIKFALCFPDLYEVGMSNLGVRILYHLLNNVEDTCCERFFSPAKDMEEMFRNKNREISSLESGAALNKFDFVGFSLAHELTYTNVLNILDLGSIPFYSWLRDPSYPLVIGGGPCALNPEPLSDFFDLFVIGEAEEAILEIIDKYRQLKARYKSGQTDKEELLRSLSRIEGVYVPSLYEIDYSDDGSLTSFKAKVKEAPRIIKKRFIKEFDTAFFPIKWLVPYIQIVHDRITLEIMRGCPNRCRFCQARSQYFPYRQKNADIILKQACEIYRLTGYEEISLGGLSVSEYGGIDSLVSGLISLFKEKAVSVSLPSIKPTGRVGALSELMASIKKTGLTFAPEAATERLRKLIGKDFDLDEFWKTLGHAYSVGYRHVKLYFMIGLPREQESDLDGIIEFSREASERGRGISKGPAEVNLSINTVIPKPHTPFQWFGMEPIEKIQLKQLYIKNKIRNKRISLNFHNCKMSFIEGVLSRGDRRLSSVILAAFKNQARFDSWSDSFNFEAWMAAFSANNIDPYFYLKEKRDDEFLPWDFIDTGIDKEFLKQEASRMNQENQGLPG